MAKEKIGIITLGCSKNTVDSERLASQLKLNKLDLVENIENADTVIINTCGFIDAAKEESVNTILEASELKKRGSIKKLIVAGCLSERYMDELKTELTDVDSFHGTEDYEGILRQFGGNLKDELLGERELSESKHYAYLKISEGCDNPCSFCAIPLMRGKHETKSIEALVDESKRLADKGVKELIIIGQDTTDFGKELYGKRVLGDLLNQLSEIGGIEWIRLLYAYPSHFPEDAMRIIADNPKVCNYIDMPLQHISDKVLKSMRRGITKRRTVELIETLKATIPNLTLRTTFIVGYPAETKTEFEELCEFIKETKFDRIGVFNYSVEENTPSYILGDPISAEEKEERKSTIMELQKDISLNKNQALVGSEQKVIIDGIEGEYYLGRTSRDAPEVDGEVLIKNDSKLIIGDFYGVKIYDCDEYDLFGKLK